ALAGQYPPGAEIARAEPQTERWRPPGRSGPRVRLRVSVYRHQTHATFQLWPRSSMAPPAASCGRAAFAPVPAAVTVTVTVAVAVAVAAPPAGAPPVVASRGQSSRRSPGLHALCAARACQSPSRHRSIKFRGPAKLTPLRSIKRRNGLEDAPATALHPFVR